MKNVCVLMLFVLGGMASGCGPDHVPIAGTWTFMPDPSNEGIRDEWFATSADRSAWEEMTVPDSWESHGHDGYDGAAWYATTLKAQESGPVSLVFMGVDDNARVWVNGVEAGSHVGYSEPFEVPIPDSLSKDSMLVVVQVIDRGGPGGIVRPVYLVPSSEAEEAMKSPYAHETARKSADWVTHAVLYEVYVRSFSDGGTFEDLRMRLPELKDLGVTVLWLMPIHPIGELNRKGTYGSPYSIRDYRDVDSRMGTMDDFKRLVADVHAQDMKLILDFVANHTAWDSDLLIHHPEWYTRDEEGAIIAPNPDWHDVADLNYDQHELRKYMIDVMTYWVGDIGVDGFRCDVAELVPTDFWEHARHDLDDMKPVMMLAEGDLPEYHLDSFDLTYAWNTYDVLGALFDGSAAPSVIPRLLKKEALRDPVGSLRMRFNTNHDKTNEDGTSAERWGIRGAELASTLTFVLPGVPLIYNGEEVGNTTRLSLFEKIPIDWSHGQDVRSHFKALTSLRRQYPWLVTASWESIDYPQAPRALLLVRTDESTGRSLLAILNFSPDAISIDLPMPKGFRRKNLREHFTAARIAEADRLSLQLPGWGFSVLTAEETQ